MEDQQSVAKTSNKKTPRWVKWIVFYAVGVLTFIIGQALVDMSLIGSKWWLILLVCMYAYWHLFVRTPEFKDEKKIQYDWGKKK